MIKLTDHQLPVAEKIAGKILKLKPTVIELSGRAGTGKTTVLNYILRKVVKSLALRSKITTERLHVTIDCIAPTRKATAILRNSLDELPAMYPDVSMHISTVYAFLSDRRHKLVYAGGIKRESLFTPIGIHGLSSHPIVSSEVPRIIVIDEISTLTYAERESIDHLYHGNAIILLTGDLNQTNLDHLNEFSSGTKLPVDMSQELIEPIRQNKDSHIYRLSEYFRLAIQGKSYDLLPGEFKNSSELCTLKSWDHMVNKFVTMPEDFMYLAWTNRALENAHSMMKDKSSNDKFPDNCLHVLKDTIRVNSKNHYKGSALRIDGKIITIHKSDKRIDTSKIEDGDQILKQITESIILYPLRTIHSTQGATVREVIIDTSDLINIPSPEQLARLYYTAISRATHKVYFTNMDMLKKAITKVKV